jgi:AraC-like DNA-binding protein
MDHFLPKSFNLNVNDLYCSDYQFGKNKTFSHWHSGAEIIYVIKGKVNVMFNNSWHLLESGSMIFIPPKQLHFCDCNDNTAEKIVIGFVETCLYRDRVAFSTPNTIIEHCVLHNLENTNVPRLMREFNEHCKNKAVYAEDLMARSALLQIYAYLVHYWSKLGLNVNNDTQNEMAYRVYKYIEEHFTEDLSPYDIAKQFSISYSNLAKIMQKFNKTTFTECVNQIRIENAKKMLALTSKSITEIGLECGFSGASYFIKIFHRMTGMKPNQYRKLTEQKESSD